MVGNRHDNIKFYEENCTVNFGNTPIFFCPWINTENYGSTMKGIQGTDADICMGHLEINGFEMHKGHFSENGHPKEMFKNLILYSLDTFTRNQMMDKFIILVQLIK